MRRKRKSRLAAAEFIGILTVTAVVFIKARAYAGAWRGYDAMGGEFFCSCSYLLYITCSSRRYGTMCATSWSSTRTRRRTKYVGKKKPPTLCESVGGACLGKTSEITHTFIIIPLSGVYCNSELRGAESPRAGSYGILTNRPKRTLSRR